MKPGLSLIESVLSQSQPTAPTFLVALEPWHRTFFRNLWDLRWPRSRPSLDLSSQPAPFWNDVFVVSGLPWGRFVESAIFHTAAIMALWGAAQLWPRTPQLLARTVFHSSDVVRYELSDYLPPLDTGSVPAPAPQKGDPVYAPQPILSVPSEPDNREQTIVTPPKLKLSSAPPLPNIVAWGQAAPVVPAVAIASRASDLRLPMMPIPAVAPPPEVARSRMDRAPTPSASAVAPAPQVSAVLTKREMGVPQAAVVEPPPSIETASTRKLGDINIGHAQVVAPAPQLPVDEQHALTSMAQASLGNVSPSVVPPPPTVQGTGVSNEEGRLIALSVHPAPLAPVEAPNGNRRGTFAATPEGKPGATGTPEIQSSNRSASGSSGGKEFGKSISGVPSGLFVGTPKAQISLPGGGPSSGSDPNGGDPPLAASLAEPTLKSAPRSLATALSPDQESAIEQQVFGIRKSYAMMLSVPNLNSAGGSWVMHFSELQEGGTAGQLFAPVATRTADPGYPLELMRQNVKGTVTLSAVIRSDGSVAEVRVLNGVDDRLDEYARAALARWHFLPAMRNGNPVNLQAVVMIPFKPNRRITGF